MKSAGKIITTLVLLAMIFLSLTGCLSQQNGNNTGSIQQAQRSSAVATPRTTSITYKIRIDPIADYITDSTFNITGSAHLVVNGTTTFPPGTSLNLMILEQGKSRDLIRTEIEVKSNNSGLNSFSYDYNLIGNPRDDIG